MEMKELREIVQEEEISCKQNEAALALVLDDQGASALCKGQMFNIVRMLIVAMKEMPDVKFAVLAAVREFNRMEKE